MKHSSTMMILSSAALLAASLGAAMAQDAAPPPGGPGTRSPQPPRTPPAAGDVRKGHIAAPTGSETLTGELGPISIQMYEAANFKGTEATLSGVDTTIAPGGLNELPKGLADSMTSLRWNLPAGVAVVFYEDAGGKGEQLVVWGKGQSPDVSKWDFNDKASRWAWYDVGGGPGTSHSAAAKLPPNGVKPLNTAVPDNSLQLYKDHKFENDMQQIAPVSGVAAGQLHDIPAAIDDSLTSLRWNLPEGVIVTLYQDAGGEKQQVAIWGKGQVEQLDLWDFNDKVSRWSWAYVGTPATGGPQPRE